jgi:hypothetical protein
LQRTAWLLAFVLAISACITVSAMTALRDRAAVLTEAEASLAATARLLEAHADRALESGQRAVQAIVQAVGDPRTMHQSDRVRALHRQLQDAVQDSPQLASAWVLDADGGTVAESGDDTPLPAGSFVPGEYFQAHRDGEAGSHICGRACASPCSDPTARPLSSGPSHRALPQAMAGPPGPSRRVPARRAHPPRRNSGPFVTSPASRWCSW